MPRLEDWHARVCAKRRVVQAVQCAGALSDVARNIITACYVVHQTRRAWTYCIVLIVAVLLKSRLCGIHNNLREIHADRLL